MPATAGWAVLEGGGLARFVVGLVGGAGGLEGGPRAIDGWCSRGLVARRVT